MAPPSANGEAYIVGGDKVVDTNDPRTRATVHLSLKGKGRVCTGFIAEKNLIVTAAHCLSITQSLTVDFGLLVSSAKKIPGKTFKWHPKYTGQSVNWDIGYILLDTPIPEGFAPLPIWSDLKALKKGQKVFQFGYGLTATTAKDVPGHLRMIDNIFKKVATESSSPSGVGLVLLGPNPGKGFCPGDSGGPSFVQDKDGNWFVLGVANAFESSYYPEVSSSAFDKDMCATGANIYAAVVTHKKWIEDNSGVKLLTMPQKNPQASSPQPPKESGSKEDGSGPLPPSSSGEGGAENNDPDCFVPGL